LKLKEKKKEVEIRMVVHLLPECEGVLPSQKWRWENVKNKKKQTYSGMMVEVISSNSIDLHI
jgi:hypothetical protein